MKFKIFDKTVKKTFGPFNMSDIKAYDGEVHSIFFTNGDNPDIIIGDDLGYGRNNTEKIQDNLKFLLFTGLFDNNGKELYDGDFVEYVEDELYLKMGKGKIEMHNGTWKIVTAFTSMVLDDVSKVVFSNYQFF